MSITAEGKKFTVKLVSLRHSHHSDHSGYDTLAHYLDAPVHSPISKKPFLFLPFHLIPKSVVRRIVIRGGVQYYYEPFVYDELCIMADWMLHSRRIYHFLFGENCYRYLGLLKRFRPHRIVCTFHLPPEKFLEISRVTHHLGRLDGIIVLARHMADFFSRFLPREKIFFVPHGVDTDFYSPGEGFSAPTDSPFCLFVGRFLRDFQTLREVIVRLNERGDMIRFVLLPPPDKFHLFEDLDNVELLSEVSAEKLLELYREAALLLMPLEDAVANNTILEAMSCGLPIMSSDVGGIRDYVNRECAVLCERGDSAAMAEAVLELTADASRLRRMRGAARARALEFDWRIIAGRVREVYEKVALAGTNNGME